MGSFSMWELDPKQFLDGVTSQSDKRTEDWNAQLWQTKAMFGSCW